MSKHRLLRLALERGVVFVMILTSLVGTGAFQVSPHPPRQATSPALTQPVSNAQLAPVQSSPASPAGTWYAPHQPVYGPQAVIPTTPTFPQGRKPGEQADLRTAASETFLNADGTWTRKSYTVPIHYKDAQGNWQRVDNTLIADSSDTGYAYGNRANDFRVHFVSQAGGPNLVHAQFPGVKVAESLDGAASVSATITGSTIVYTGVFPGVDLRYSLGLVSLEETLLLQNAQAPASYTFTYHLPGASASQDAAGNVIFTDAKGTVLLVIGGLLMYEADSQGQMRPQTAVSEQIQVALSSKGPDFHITYTPDHAWLSDPKRHFPVAIDPTWQGGDAGQSTTNGNISADTMSRAAIQTRTSGISIPCASATVRRAGWGPGPIAPTSSFPSIPRPLGLESRRRICSSTRVRCLLVG
jgi:hypothetical protein